MEGHGCGLTTGRGGGGGGRTLLLQGQLLPGFRSVAERFRQAYVDQAARAREKERREAEAARRRELRASVVLRAEAAWLDERTFEF